MNQNTGPVIIEARLNRTLRRHAFSTGDTSMCGLAHINECDKIRMCKVSRRLQLYVWPQEDLNYCGRCRICLNAKSLIV